MTATVRLTITTTDGEVIEMCEVQPFGAMKAATPAALSNEIIDRLDLSFELELLDPATRKPLGDE
jgi:hypothetical protein